MPSRAVSISTLPLELSKPKFLEDHACRFIERHRRDPFVLFVAFVEPHTPYNGPLNEEHSLAEVDLDQTALTPPTDEVPFACPSDPRATTRPRDT